jgi:uncharacterized membrane protein YgcG
MAHGPYFAFVDCLQLLACCALCNLCYNATAPRDRIVVVRDAPPATRSAEGGSDGGGSDGGSGGSMPLIAVSNVSIER